ncbi:MAG: hypothetical protein ACYSR5_03455 [Planctomycetota bacterium]
MKSSKSRRSCRNIRAWLYGAISRRIGPDAGWVQNHIANCKRCQKRIASAGKVNLALSLIKCQPHGLDLLMRANTQAIGVLGKSLRDVPKAQKLKATLPGPKLLERCSQYKHGLVNAAACIAILFLMKTGVFSSMDKVQTEGHEAVKHYYASHAGQELADEIFSS